MKKERLLKLADELVRDAKRKRGIKFDLDTVIKPPEDGSEPTVSCGTAACAIGLWGLCGKFRGVGIADWGHNLWGPTYRGRIGRDAAELYFDITDRESAWLFLSQYYDNPQRGATGELQVAKRIRDFAHGRIQSPEH